MSMTNLRLITRSACALGAAMLATTALQVMPAQARGHSGGHAGSSAHITTHKGFLTTHKGFRIARETTGQHGPVSGGKQLGGGDIFTKPNGVSGGSGGSHAVTPPVPPATPPSNQRYHTAAPIACSPTRRA